ncbi:hypothetical protein IAQ61_009910 [Plenodomus lingam]|uniref:uncharacterized protein n=1 Tax=Leptosphaeria maculans TaxID=5022 RepID=UPI00332324F8|nr:hypothetical protein IAQ61_009910 [Plenodomus lingam]
MTDSNTTLPLPNFETFLYQGMPPMTTDLDCCDICYRHCPVPPPPPPALPTQTPPITQYITLDAAFQLALEAHYPVRLARCGHCFCRPCLLTEFAVLGLRNKCPMCRRVLFLEPEYEPLVVEWGSSADEEGEEEVEDARMQGRDGDDGLGAVAEGVEELGPVAEGEEELGPVAEGEEELGPVAEGEEELGPVAEGEEESGTTAEGVQASGPSASNAQAPEPSTSSVHSSESSPSNGNSQRPSASTVQPSEPSASNMQSPGPAASSGHSPGPAASSGHSPGPAASSGHSPGPAASSGHSPGPAASSAQSSGPSASEVQLPGPSNSHHQMTTGLVNETLTHQSPLYPLPQSFQNNYPHSSSPTGHSSIRRGGSSNGALLPSGRGRGRLGVPNDLPNNPFHAIIARPMSRRDHAYPTVKEISPSPTAPIREESPDGMIAMRRHFLPLPTGSLTTDYVESPSRSNLFQQANTDERFSHSHPSNQASARESQPSIPPSPFLTMNYRIRHTQSIIQDLMRDLDSPVPLSPFQTGTFADRENRSPADAGNASSNFSQTRTYNPWDVQNWRNSPWNAQNLRARSRTTFPPNSSSQNVVMPGTAPTCPYPICHPGTQPQTPHRSSARNSGPLTQDRGVSRTRPSSRRRIARSFPETRVRTLGPPLGFGDMANRFNRRIAAHVQRVLLQRRRLVQQHGFGEITGAGRRMMERTDERDGEQVGAEETEAEAQFADQVEE